MKTVKMIVLTAVLTMVWGCSKDDDGTSAQYIFTSTVKPTWSVNLTGDDAAPGWQDIDRTLYESWMYITVKLQDELAPYASDGDRMVVFIGDEQRTRPAAPNMYADGSVYFVLTIGGNSTDREVNMRLCYWCAKLSQLFAIEGQATFTPELPYGNTSDYMPPLLSGSSKYPVQQQLTVTLPASVSFAVSPDDVVAVFAGSECRGVGTIGQPFTVFRTSVSEPLQVRYYRSEQLGTYSFVKNVTLKDTPTQTLTLDL